MDREKFQFLPVAHNYVENQEPSPAASETPEIPVTSEHPGIYPCPCCGYRTFPVPAAEAIAAICPVCFWENDVFLTQDDEPSDENNGLTLCQARENYRTYGAVQLRLVRYVRPPKPEEQPTEV